MYRAKETGPSRIVGVPDRRRDRHHPAPAHLERAAPRPRTRRARALLPAHGRPPRPTTMVGMEALVRWHHPTRGLLLPGEFIGLAEDTRAHRRRSAPGSCARRAARRAEWERAAPLRPARTPGRLNISVNVSAQQLADPTFPRQVASALTESGLDPDKLWLEITESTLMSTGDASVATLDSLRALGPAPRDRRLRHRVLVAQLPEAPPRRDPQGGPAASWTSSTATPMTSPSCAPSSPSGNRSASPSWPRASSALRRRRRSPALGCMLAQGYLFGVPPPPARSAPFPADDLHSWQAEVRTSA